MDALEHESWRAVPGLRHGFLPGRFEPSWRVTLPRQVHGTRVLTADPGTGVMRHADAGYPEAIATAEREGLRIPMREEGAC